MQIEWMDSDFFFRNLTAKVWANLDNPIKSSDVSKFSLISCMPPSQVALRWLKICDVATVYNYSLMELYTKFHFSWKYAFPLILYWGMLGLRWLCMHLWLHLIKITNCENICTKSVESRSLVVSQILAELRLEKATYIGVVTKLCEIITLKRIIQICSNFYCWVSKRGNPCRPKVR